MNRYSVLAELLQKNVDPPGFICFKGTKRLPGISV